MFEGAVARILILLRTFFLSFMDGSSPIHEFWEICSGIPVKQNLTNIFYGAEIHKKNLSGWLLLIHISESIKIKSGFDTWTSYTIYRSEFTTTMLYTDY